MAATEDQREAIALLADPATHGGAAVARIDTHSSAVFLAGERAYKLKRAVRFPFLDYSTAERRRAMCEAELAINRRTAPSLYLGVAPIARRPDGRLALGAEGVAVDWVVVMRRFADDALFEARARAGLLDLSTMLALADKIARFHHAAPRRHDRGGRTAMKDVVDGLAAGLAGFAGKGLGDGAVRRFATQAGAALASVGDLLDRRRAAGFVRHVHGDLHLRNVCLWEGEPTLFDAIEFNDDLAVTDVLYDLAFLAMDMQHRGLAVLGNAVFNRYLARALAADGLPAVEGLAALPLFLSCRAAVRARVTMDAVATQADPARAERRREEARSYLALALDLLRPAKPRLVAVGGLSGTGKSTLAHALAPALGPAPGALVVRSDVLRKAILGADLFDRLPQSAYGAQTTARVFDMLNRAAAAALAAGHAAVADAVFLQPAQRRDIEQAAACGARFDGFWLEAPDEVVERRIAARAKDVSDATLSVARQQRGRNPGALAWTRLDAGRPLADVAREARACLGLDARA